MAGLKDRWDALSVEELRRRRGGEKWSQYPDCIGAFVAEMDFGTAPAVEEALREAIERAAFGYMSDPLVAELGEACSALYADRWGWSPPAGWIRPVADVIKAAEIAIQLYSPPGSAVILPTPNYMPFLKLPGQLGRELIEVPMRRSGRWQFDLEAIELAFRQGGHTLLLCNPANPLGRVFERDELLALAQVVDRNGGRVFADEIHAAITYPGHQHIPYASLSPTTAAHTLTAFSASKAWNVPGLKCAQLLFSNEADRVIWEERGAYFGYGASTLGVTANIAAFRAGGPWQAEVMDYLAGNRQRFGEILADQAPEIPYSPPEGTYLAWLDLRDFAQRKGIAAGAGELSAWFRRETGVAMTDGADCGEAGRGFLRFNFALPRPILEGAALAVARAIAAPPHH